MKRSTCLASLVIAFAWSMETRAGGPPPVYMVVDKVVFEPNEEVPTRIQIWGAFSLLREGDSYESPVRGYLYYAAAPGAEEKCRKEWAVLKKMTGKKQLISFGICREPDARDHLRKPTEEVASPNLYPHGKGGVCPRKECRIQFSLPQEAACLSHYDRPPHRQRTHLPVEVVFGAEAETGVWLVLDGDALYLDRNAN